MGQSGSPAGRPPPRRAGAASNAASRRAVVTATAARCHCGRAPAAAPLLRRRRARRRVPPRPPPSAAAAAVAAGLPRVTRSGGGGEGGVVGWKPNAVRWRPSCRPPSPRVSDQQGLLLGHTPCRFRAGPAHWPVAAGTPQDAPRGDRCGWRRPPPGQPRARCGPRRVPLPPGAGTGAARQWRCAGAPRGGAPSPLRRHGRARPATGRVRRAAARGSDARGGPPTRRAGTHRGRHDRRRRPRPRGRRRPRRPRRGPPRE